MLLESVLQQHLSRAVKSMKKEETGDALLELMDQVKYTDLWLP